MVNGAVSQGYYLMLGSLLVSTALNVGYFAPVVIKAFFGQPAPDVDIDHFKEAPLTMVLPLCFTAAMSVFLGLYPETFFQFIDVFRGN
jgi:multicomponent Na+:H+ antiporter subunit D